MTKREAFRIAKSGARASGAIRYVVVERDEAGIDQYDACAGCDIGTFYGEEQVVAGVAPDGAADWKPGYGPREA